MKHKVIGFKIINKRGPIPMPIYSNNTITIYPIKEIAKIRRCAMFLSVIGIDAYNKHSMLQFKYDRVRKRLKPRVRNTSIRDMRDKKFTNIRYKIDI